MKKLCHARTFTLASFAMLAALPGCAAEDSDVKPRVEVIDRTRSALSAASVAAVNGTYGSTCSGRNADGSESWTVDLENPSNTNLSVRKNDADCVLTIVSLTAGSDTFGGTPAIALDAANAYKESASSFAIANGPLAFYGNAKISSLAFASDFTITVLVSDDPSASDSGDKGAEYATQSATAESNAVPAPSYSISYSGFTVIKDVDNVVQSVTGAAQLTAGGVAGQDYAIHEGWLDGASSFAEVDAAFAAAAKKGALSSLDGLALPAADFALVGLDLDAGPKRTVIIKNTMDGVASYQLLAVTFTP